MHEQHHPNRDTQYKQCTPYNNTNHNPNNGSRIGEAATPGPPKVHKRKLLAKIWEEEGSSDSDDPPNGYPELLTSSDEDINGSQSNSSNESDDEGDLNSPKTIQLC